MARHFVIKLPADVDDAYVAPDWHVGDLFYHPPALQKATNYINRNPEGLVLLPGDLARFFSLQERHMCFEEIEKSDFPNPAAQKNEIEFRLGEIEHKPEWSFISLGNHELTLFKKMGNYYCDKSGRGICERQGYTYCDIESYFTLKWDDGTSLKVLMTHGTRFGVNPHLKGSPPGLGWRRDGNAKMWLRNCLAGIDNGASDLYIKGHEHKAYYYEPFEKKQLIAEGDEWNQVVEREAFLNKPVWAACSGAMGKTRVSGTITYQEEASYGAADMAILHISFRREGSKRIPEIKIVDLS